MNRYSLDSFLISVKTYASFSCMTLWVTGHVNSQMFKAIETDHLVEQCCAVWIICYISYLQYSLCLLMVGCSRVIVVAG